MQLPSSFHGASLFSRRSQGRLLTNPTVHVTCSSLQSHWARHVSRPRAPESERHLTSLLTSSLHMRSPQGEALLAMANESMTHVQITQAASQQLELLVADAAECTRSKEQGGVLQRRIAEIKEGEISNALHDITLAMVTHRLLLATLAVPDQTPRQHDDAVALPHNISLDDRLQALHPPLIQPLIDRHVALVVNGKDRAQLPFQPQLVARVCPLEMGKMYAASIMHGYFLARVYQRFKLERVLQLEDVSMDPHKQRDEFGINAPKEFQLGEVSIKAYLQSIAFKDKEAFRHLSSIRCSHTLNVIERHCQALFGVHSMPSHTFILNIELGSVRSLILQALAFGALLWDVENNFIPSFYPFLN